MTSIVERVRRSGEPRRLALARHRLAALLAAEARWLLLRNEEEARRYTNRRRKWEELPETDRLLILAEVSRGIEGHW